ncbi:hypothetical protein ACQ4PT_009834 [Festuca glaucescens]
MAASFLATVAMVAASVPAVYVFGDSLADVRNNNHLLTLLKADFPHNGMDYPGGKATGRFSNGKNSADFLDIHIFVYKIQYYSTVYASLARNLGQAQAASHLAKSIFAITIGSNDIIHYAKAATKLRNPSQQFVDALIQSLTGQLQSLHNLGARKVVFLGVGPVGCTPSLRELSSTKDCGAEANAMAVQYNKAAEAVLSGMSAQHPDLHYALFDSSAALLRYIDQPAAYGFAEAKAACCGLGDLNAKIACTPISHYCSNRSDHVFWDFYHPTEATAQKLSSTAFDGSPPFIFLINIRQLSEI